MLLQEIKDQIQQEKAAVDRAKGYLEGLISKRDDLIKEAAKYGVTDISEIPEKLAGLHDYIEQGKGRLEEALQTLRGSRGDNQNESIN